MNNNGKLFTSMVVSPSSNPKKRRSWGNGNDGILLGPNIVKPFRGNQQSVRNPHERLLKDGVRAKPSLAASLTRGEETHEVPMHVQYASNWEFEGPYSNNHLRGRNDYSASSDPVIDQRNALKSINHLRGSCD